MEGTGSGRRAQTGGGDGSSLAPGSYFDGFGGFLRPGNGHQQTGLGHHLLLGGETTQGQPAPWGWETYTSYNMMGLFSAHVGGRRAVRPFITSITCDPFYELLWLGWTNGFLSSFRFPHCSRYTSFPVGIPETLPRSMSNGPFRDNVIHVGFPSASHIYTVSNSGVGVYSRGGVPISCHSSRILTGEKSNSKILCGDSSRYPAYMGITQILGLGTRNGVTILDLQEFRHLRSIPYAGIISCIRSSAAGNSFIVGGVNMLGIADPRLPRLGNTVQIHSTNQASSETFVSGLAVSEYTVAVITTTISDRKIGTDGLLNSVGGNSGLAVLDLLRAHPTEVTTSLEMIAYKKNLDISNMSRDSVVRLFDIRKFRPRKNISFTPGPINIAWGDDSLAASTKSSANHGSEDLYIVGNNGQWQVYHSDLDRMEFYAIPSVPLSTLGFSSSGNYLIIGDTSGSVHTMQRPHQNAPTSKPTDQIQHSFSMYQTLPLPNLNLGLSIRPGGAGCGSGPDGPICLYNFSYLRSVQSLMGVASNPVTKPLSNGLGHPTAPNLTVALRYLQGRPVVAYDALNPVGIPPILERSPQTGKITVKDDELLSFSNKYDVEEIRNIQMFYGWSRFKMTDELPCGVSLSKPRAPGVGDVTTAISPPSSPPGYFSLDYYKEIRPEIDSYKLRGFEFRTVDFVRVAPNPDPSKLRNNNLLYGLPLLSFGGNLPIWYFRRKRNLIPSSGAPSGIGGSLVSGGVGGVGSLMASSSIGSGVNATVVQDGIIQRNPQLSQVPVRFQYKPRLNHNRREKSKPRRSDVASNNISGEGGKPDDDGSHFSSFSSGDGQGIVSIELENDALDFTQPFFVLFSLIPRLSYEILLSHIPDCRSEFCLACELVHLTLMVQGCKRNLGARGRSRVVRSVPISGSSGVLSSNSGSFVNFSGSTINSYQGSLFPYVSSGSIYILNMLRTIRHLPDAKQLGIDSDETNSSVLAGIAAGNLSLEEQFQLQLQLSHNGAMNGIGGGSSPPYSVFNQIRKIEMFWKFFLENLKKSLRQAGITEFDPKVRQQNCCSLLDSLFGVEVATISSCVQSKHTFRSSQIVAAVEIVSNHLVSQNNADGGVGDGSGSSSFGGQNNNSSIGSDDSKRTDRFLLALNTSLLRIVAGRSYCRDCGVPTACQHVRCVTRLPKILVVSCNVQNMKNWSDFGGMLPEEYEDLARKSSSHGNSSTISNNVNVINSGGLSSTSTTLCENPNSCYSIPWEIRFSRLRKGFGPNVGSSSGSSIKESTGIDIIQVDRSKTNSDGSSNTQIYELVAVMFGVYQGNSIQLPSGTHFCMYVKHSLLFNEKTDTSIDGKWFLVNGSSVQQVNNKNEILNFSTCWKIPVFLFYRDKDQRLDEFLFSGFPCIGFSPSTDRLYSCNKGRGVKADDKSEQVRDKLEDKQEQNEEQEHEQSGDEQKQGEVNILEVKFKIPWKYPKEIQDHVIKQLTSIIQLIRTEKNLSEHSDQSQILNQSPFSMEELSLLCRNYYVRYPFAKGLLKETAPFRDVVEGSGTGIGMAGSNIEGNDVNENQFAKKHLEFVRNSPMIVALDSEYVALTEEQSVVRPDGTKEILKKSQLSLARVSIVRCGAIPLLMQQDTSQANGNGDYGESISNNGVDLSSRNGIILDNYISHGSNNSQQPKDYLTKYSGVKPGDLDPKTSNHFLTSKACVLKKLQFLVDAGVVFIGHALQSDFKIINIYVPPFQIIDTVEIYRLPDERYISLRFLAKYVLNENIQAEVHDSIVDAKTAFELFLRYLSHKKNNTWNDFLTHLYSKGHSVDWKIEALLDTQNIDHLQFQQ
ncbi:PAN2 family exonuclease [Cryptosporidium bovis]|uniref:PAN2 family exonuclease n=1 Tax=Cryptosporidium bovis TaxID=310047 RepID=UPI00351A9F30|nr:PAN2 family exonuclease [Cryptosporidium bovis]